MSKAFEDDGYTISCTIFTYNTKNFLNVHPSTLHEASQARLYCSNKPPSSCIDLKQPTRIPIHSICPQCIGKRFCLLSSFRISSWRSCLDIKYFWIDMWVMKYELWDVSHWQFRFSLEELSATFIYRLLARTSLRVLSQLDGSLM